MHRRIYDTDLTDDEWSELRPLLPPAKHGGRPREVELREVVNAIFYLQKTGCQWRMIPHGFPPRSTVFDYFDAWKKDGTWKRVHDFFRRKVRRLDGRRGQPSAAIIDSQSVKSSDVADDAGYDAGKKIKGRKRHLLVDTLGLVLAVVVHSAAIQDRDGARLVFDRCENLRRMKLVWADGAYAGELVSWVKKSSAGYSRSSSAPMT
jgi:putative transposase